MCPFIFFPFTNGGNEEEKDWETCSQTVAQSSRLRKWKVSSENLMKIRELSGLCKYLGTVFACILACGNTHTGTHTHACAHLCLCPLSPHNPRPCTFHPGRVSPRQLPLGEAKGKEASQVPLDRGRDSIRQGQPYRVGTITMPMIPIL